MTDREQNARVRERFTRSAEPFARFAVPNRMIDAETIARLANPHAGDRALDLACGPGTFTAALAARAGFVCGLDLTPAMLALARRRMAEGDAGNVAFVCGDATALPFPTGAFDVAVSGYSLHHVSDPLGVLRELARVVRRGGRVALVDIYVPEGASGEANDGIERARDASHCHTLGRAEFPALVEEAGFSVGETESLERPRRFTDWMNVAGWKPGDPAFEATRRLLEATLADDAAGFHPRPIEAELGARAEIEFTQCCCFLAAERI